MTTPLLRLSGLILSAGLLLSLSARDHFLGQVVSDPVIRSLMMPVDPAESEAELVPTPYGMQDLQAGPGWVWRPTPEELERFAAILERGPVTITPDNFVERWTLEWTPERRRQLWMDDDLTLREEATGFTEVDQDVPEDTTVEGSYL